MKDRELFVIIQPKGINYMIQKSFYSEDDAKGYLKMLIDKMERYIVEKKSGKRVAPLMTLSEMENQLAVMKTFTVKRGT